MPEQGIDEEHDTTFLSSGQPHSTTLEGERRGSTEETSSDESSDKNADYSCDDYDDDQFTSTNKNDMVTSKSVSSNSLGINLELVLEISQEDMLMDEASTPWDE